MQKYEKGTNRIGSSRLMQIAAALRKPIGMFYEGAPGGTGGAVAKGADIRGEFFAHRARSTWRATSCGST